MPAGTFPCGAGPCGWDPIAKPSKSTPVLLASAGLFDPATGDFRFDRDGRVVPIHPVDQAVAIALTVVKGAIGGDADCGHTLRSLPRASPSALPGQVSDAVARALKTITDRGDATVLSVTTTQPARGAYVAIVSYVNNQTNVANATQVTITSS